MVASAQPFARRFLCQRQDHGPGGRLRALSGARFSSTPALGLALFFSLAFGSDPTFASGASTGHDSGSGAESGAAHAAPEAAAVSAGGGLCQGFGPQTPRDIANFAGLNRAAFAMAPPAAAMNLCNIHTHTNAEHRGPGFSIQAGGGKSGGYLCNETRELSIEEQIDPTGGHGAFEGIHPGDTIEVHWVFTSCDVTPGPGLGSCVSETCSNPTLRVESQVFLVVNDDDALNFHDFDYAGHQMNGLNQPLSLPTGTGDPIVFRGSTTGPKYTESTCSPYQVTWSVRPSCAKLSYASVNSWAANGNIFEETHSHGVRELVTAPELLAPIQY